MLLMIVVLLIGFTALPADAEEVTINRYCNHCLNWVDWTPWSADDASVSSVETGHYYLTENMPNSAQKTIRGIVCLDLNGFTISATKRALLSSVTQHPAGPVLNIFDSVGGGMVVTSGGTNNPAGGTVTISGGGVVNLYSGTLKYVTTKNSVTTCGGVVCAYGANSTFNMYGGCVDGSACVLTDDSGNKVSACADGSGAAIAAYSGGVINLAGGRVIAGKANESVGRGDCIFIDDADSEIILGGDAEVDEIYFEVSSAENFNINGKYTGSAVLVFNPSITLSEGVDVGDLILNGNITGANLTCAAEGYFVDALDADLVLSYADPNSEATVIDGDTVTNYATWEEAFAKANGRRIRLNKDITEAVTIKQDTYLDLNGYSITGALTVETGTLYCLDSETDDFTVKDGVYGKLTDVTGTVLGLPLESDIADDAYFMITDEEKKEISFHRIGLQLTSMTLRAESTGIYYKSAFGGDEMVKECVDAYGVALSIMGEPTAENLNSECKRTVFTDFQAGGNDTDATSTLLWGVVKETNARLINYRNANRPIYGRAYILLKDGTYLFGASANRSFREQVEMVSGIWDDLTAKQKSGVYDMYTRHQNIMKEWNVANVKAFKDPSQDDVLRILNISNSHGVDSIWQLPSVLKAECPDQKFVIVELYQGYALTEHKAAAEENAAVYYYRINKGDGWTHITSEATIQDVLQTHSWDIVMFNESSRHLGLESKMSQGLVDWFLNYILENLDYKPKMLYNMTWASPTDENFYTDTNRQSAPSTFRNTYTKDYGFDHVNHYNQLVAMTKKYLVGHEGFDKIIYNATPVQYAGEILHVPQYDADQVYDLYRDYTHLSDYARLIVAYNWYCQMFEVEELKAVNVDVIEWENRATWNNRNEKLGDLTLTEQHKSVLMQSVNHSLKNPLSITTE